MNAGRLDAYTGTAVYLGAGGSVTNQVSGVIYGRTGAITSTGTASLSLGNSGAITSGTGAAVSAYRGGLTNSGYLAGLAGAVNFTNGGEVSNAAGGVLKVRNYSRGQRPGLLSAIEVQGAPASIDNSGTILGPRGIYVRAGGTINEFSLWRHRVNLCRRAGPGRPNHPDQRWQHQRDRRAGRLFQGGRYGHQPVGGQPGRQHQWVCGGHPDQGWHRNHYQ